MSKKSCLLVLFALTVVAMLPGRASTTETDVGVSFDKDGLSGFYLAIGEHYQVTEKDILVVRKKSILDEELPVVFFIARKAGVPHAKVMEMRIEGRSWMEITIHFGLTAEIFYVPFKDKPGPPYGKAWGHFKSKKNDKRAEIRLTDPDIVNFVNLIFISEKYRCAPEEVVKMRAKGDNFVMINAKVKGEKKKVKVAEADVFDQPAKGKSKKK